MDLFLETLRDEDRGAVVAHPSSDGTLLFYSAISRFKIHPQNYKFPMGNVH